MKLLVVIEKATGSIGRVGFDSTTTPSIVRTYHKGLHEDLAESRKSMKLQLVSDIPEIKRMVGYHIHLVSDSISHSSTTEARWLLDTVNSRICKQSVSTYSRYQPVIASSEMFYTKEDESAIPILKDSDIAFILNEFNLPAQYDKSTYVHIKHTTEEDGMLVPTLAPHNRVILSKPRDVYKYDEVKNLLEAALTAGSTQGKEINEDIIKDWIDSHLR